MDYQDHPVRLRHSVFSVGTSVSRRQLLLACAGIAAVWAGSRALGRPLQDLCLSTPPQTEGPYYPPQAQIDALLDKDNDLTQVKGKPSRATGQVIYISGRVRDAQCRPIEGAFVEIWQASANGRYNHPRDRFNPAPLDPHFQYWGNALTDQEGRYLFKTIIPGRYQAGPGWIRPSHVHFKIRRRDRQGLTTQMYFAGDPYHETDYILNDVPAAERSRVVVQLEEPGREFERGSKVCRFDLTL